MVECAANYFLSKFRIRMLELEFYHVNGNANPTALYFLIGLPRSGS